MVVACAALTKCRQVWIPFLAARSGKSSSLNVATAAALAFYERALAAAGGQPEDLERFLRFFLIPGMSHCSGSTAASPGAPWYVAGGSQEHNGTTHSVPGFADADGGLVVVGRLGVKDVVDGGGVAGEFGVVERGDVEGERARHDACCGRRERER